MRIGETFESHAQLWKALPESVRSKKSARTNRFGDVYEPKSVPARRELKKEAYHDLHPDHPHENRSEDKDIHYENKQNGNISKLLLDDAHHSCLWMKPRITLNGKHPRNCSKWSSPDEFLNQLKESGK